MTLKTSHCDSIRRHSKRPQTCKNTWSRCLDIRQILMFLPMWGELLECALSGMLLVLRLGARDFRGLCGQSALVARPECEESNVHVGSRGSGVVQ